MNKILIVGLGNPGNKYKNTPHNAGFESVDVLIEELRDKGYAVGESHSKEAAVYDVPMEGKRVIIVKPLLYMNRSGEVVKKMLTDNMDNENLWVLHDDVDLPIGSLRIKKGGSPAGHRGVENIIQHLGTKDFYRFKIGVKPEGLPDRRPPEIMSNFVTKKLRGENKEALKKITATCGELIIKAIELEDIAPLLGDYSIE